MPIEHKVVRDLNIRFIDARALVTEAKLALGINGYPSEEVNEQLYKKVMEIFEERPEKEKTAMRILKESLDIAKMPIGSLHSVNEEEASTTTTTTTPTGVEPSLLSSSVRKVISLGSIRLRRPTSSLPKMTHAAHSVNNATWGLQTLDGVASHQNASWGNQSTKISTNRLGGILGIKKGPSSSIVIGGNDKSPRQMGRKSPKQRERKGRESPKREKSPMRAKSPLGLALSIPRRAQSIPGQSDWQAQPDRNMNTLANPTLVA